MKLSDKEIKQLAFMMKLSLNQKEVEKFQSEISSILEFVSKLKEIDVSGIPDGAQVNGETNNWREDVLNGETCEPEILLEAAPERKDDFIKVPGVFKNE